MTWSPSTLTSFMLRFRPTAARLFPLSSIRTMSSDLSTQSSQSAGSTPAATTADTGSKASSEAPSRFSIFADSKTEIHQETPTVPMSVIIRPFPSLLDEAKVSRFMAEWSDSEFTPIEVLRVRVPGTTQSYYYSLGGCHRFEAAKRLGEPSIRGKIIEVPPNVMRSYLGAGAPF